METRYQRILLATALDEGATEVLEQALELARQSSAEVTVVHALEPLSEFGQSLVDTYLLPETGAELYQKNIGQLKEEIHQRVQRLCNEQGGDAPVADIRVVEGIPEVVILETATAINANLIVMGVHRHSRATEAILGTTTSRVLHSTMHPVLVVPIQ